MNKPKIKRVDNGKNKSKTYAELISKYNNAIENGFYGEAELIVYAYLEDRLRAFIYYSDLISSFNCNAINENAVELYGEPLDIKNITGKIKLIRKALNVHQLDTQDMSPLEKDLNKCYSTVLKVGEMKKYLDKIDKWCGYRNEIVHALFNKDLNDLRQHYKEHVEKGFDLARYIDNQVVALKRA